jgi:hypothetical protein
MIANRIGTHQILYIITAHNIENSHKRDQLMRDSTQEYENKPCDAQG